MKRRLYLITDGGELREKGELVKKLKEIITYGSDILWGIQLREQKGENPASDKEVEEIMDEVRGLCVEKGIHLILNRNLELTKKRGLKTFHAGSERELLAAARIQLGENGIIGFSAHSIDEFQKIEVDYFLLSPIFSPISKNKNVIPKGIDFISQSSKLTNKKIFALGGITPQNSKACLDSGAYGVACIGSLMKTDNVKRQLELFSAVL